MYRQPLGEGVVPALDTLAAGLPTSEFRDATLAWLERHYRPEATVAGSYAGAMAELLGPARHPLLRQHAPGGQAGRGAAPGARAPSRRASSTTISTDGPRRGA